MKTKKINTVPYGVAAIVIIVLGFLLFWIVGIALLPAIEAMGLFAFSFLFLVALAIYIRYKHCNFIEVTESGLCHGKDSYSWEDICITIGYSEPNLCRSFFAYCVFFDDHYLTEEECTSNSIKRKGFYLILNRKRINWLLSTYQKRIKIFDKYPSSLHLDKNIIPQIKLHNLKFVKTE